MSILHITNRLIFVATCARPAEDGRLHILETAVPAVVRALWCDNYETISNAANMTFSPFRVILKIPVPSGSLLRLAADGALPLKNLQVERIVCDGSDLPPAHRRDRAEMEKNWGWYMKTKSMAVVRVDADRFPRGLPAGTAMMVLT